MGSQKLEGEATGVDRLGRAILLRPWNPTLKGNCNMQSYRLCGSHQPCRFIWWHVFVISGQWGGCEGLGDLHSLFPLLHLQAVLTFWHSVPQLMNMLVGLSLCCPLPTLSFLLQLFLWKEFSRRSPVLLLLCLLHHPLLTILL